MQTGIEMEAFVGALGVARYAEVRGGRKCAARRVAVVGGGSVRTSMGEGRRSASSGSGGEGVNGGQQQRGNAAQKQQQQQQVAPAKSSVRVSLTPTGNKPVPPTARDPMKTLSQMRIVLKGEDAIEIGSVADCFRLLAGKPTRRNFELGHWWSKAFAESATVDTVTDNELDAFDVPGFADRERKQIEEVNRQYAELILWKSKLRQHDNERQQMKKVDQVPELQTSGSQEMKRQGERDRLLQLEMRKQKLALEEEIRQNQEEGRLLRMEIELMYRDLERRTGFKLIDESALEFRLNKMGRLITVLMIVTPILVAWELAKVVTFGLLPTVAALLSSSPI
ncbi:hypothetical protein FVE85_3902 [Porphyridium purpureum]|uniref:Uncharacterized protein n=1 Tax=Porphyridium purpureum TaxID=35688 RepID=A0A5J4YU38_PORPP|nr:hypothetical protein FVE85_3902 [Porphyridium purpureum]|eukprot:POR4592..scf229_5